MNKKPKIKKCVSLSEEASKRVAALAKSSVMDVSTAIETLIKFNCVEDLRVLYKGKIDDQQ